MQLWQKPPEYYPGHLYSSQLDIIALLVYCEFSRAIWLCVDMYTGKTRFTKLF
jgi:hypothetical protein